MEYPFYFKTKIATEHWYTPAEKTGRNNEKEYGCPLILDTLSNMGRAKMLCDLDPEYLGYYEDNTWHHW